MARKLSPGADALSPLAANATSAITNNPAAGKYGAGLLCKLDTDTDNFVVCTAGDTPNGWLGNNVAAGATASLQPMRGRRLVKVGSTGATAGGYGECGAAGTAVDLSAGPVVCRFLESGVSGDFVTAELLHSVNSGDGFAMKGTDVASATAIVPTGKVFHVTGTTTITSVTATSITAGTVITIIFDGILTFTDGSNLKLAGDFVTSADDTITLAYDGTNWYEVARSAN